METIPACKVTHRQIAKGTCPWCKSPIARSQAVPERSESDRVLDRVWNTDVLAADLADQDCDLRMATVRNLLLHSPPIDVALPLLAKALHDREGRVQDHANHGLSTLGLKLPHERVADLESQVESSDHELALRIAE